MSASYRANIRRELSDPVSDGLSRSSCAKCATADLTCVAIADANEVLDVPGYETSVETGGHSLVNQGICTISTAQDLSAESRDGEAVPRRRRKTAIWLFCAAVALSSVLAPRAHAGFLGYYDFNGTNWVISSTSDGTAFTNDSQTAVIVGGNDGSGLPGTTTALVTAPAAGTVQFNYLFNDLDQPSQGYIPDAGGYVLNGAYTQFAINDGDSGTITFSVNSGDSFGFEVWTADNTGEPGILQVSNFSAPDGGSQGGTDSVPEPATLSTVLLGAACAAVYAKINRRKKENA